MSVVSLAGTPASLAPFSSATSRAISYSPASLSERLLPPHIEANNARIPPSQVCQERVIPSSPHRASDAPTCGYSMPLTLGTAVGGRPVRIMTFFTDTPRALAVSPDKGTVYVAGFKSGNRDHNGHRADGVRRLPIPISHVPPTTRSHNAWRQPWSGQKFRGKRAPESGLIVKFNNTTHDDGRTNLAATGMMRSASRLPDLDVFAVNAGSLTQTASFAHVGFDSRYGCQSGDRQIPSRILTFNQKRFEGPGITGGSTVQGHLAEARITVISGGTVTPRAISTSTSTTPNSRVGPGFDATAKNHSLSMPLEIAVSADGTKLYVAAFGSSKVGVFNTSALGKQRSIRTLARTTFQSARRWAERTRAGRGARPALCNDTLRRLGEGDQLSTKQGDRGGGSSEPGTCLGGSGQADALRCHRFSDGEASCAAATSLGDMDDLASGSAESRRGEEEPDNDPASAMPLRSHSGKLLFGVRSPLNGTDKVDDFIHEEGR